jgi:hypothetical protein
MYTLCALTFENLCSVAASVACYLQLMHQEKLMKQGFALNKANHFVLEEGSRILSTLIPDNVWSKFRAVTAEDNRANAFSG